MISAALGMTFFPANASAVINSYHIGNSLMNDGLGSGGVTKAIETVTRSYGYDYNASYHIDGAQSLHTIWNTPSGVNGIDVVESPYGTFDNALPNYHWDHVLLEPYYGFSATLGSDKQMISNFINLTRTNPANHDTTFYIYQVWPQQSGAIGGEYSSYWAGSSPNNDSTPTRARQEYYSNLMEWAHETYTLNGIAVREVPVGEVLNRLSLMIQSGELTGIEMADFYRDNIHASANFGRYISVVTSFATMFKQSPVGLIPPSNPVAPEIHYDPAILTPQLADIFNHVIWDVVSTDYYTGIADFNNDGFVGTMDLTIWSNAFGVNDAGDADGDGDTDGRDFLHWQRNFRGEPLGFFAAVPEPGSVVLLCGVLGYCLSTRYSRR